MENIKKTTEYEFLKPPFFKANSLMFPSGHSLVLSDRNYRCSLDCRSACDLHEPQFNKENMERAFSRYAQKFVLPINDETFEFADSLMKRLFHGIVDGEDWGEINTKDEYMDTILNNMKMDVKEDGKILEEDIDELEGLFTDTTAIDSRTLLLTTLICVFKSISEPENEVHLGRDLASICRRIHLSETGKIQSVLFERWGWYILNYINKRFPEFFWKLKQNGVKILNKKDDPILSLDLKEAVKEFGGDNFEEALHSQSVQIFYSLFSMIRDIIDPVMKNEPNEKQMEAMVKGIKKIMSPQFQAMMNILQLGGARIRKKRNYKEDKSDNQSAWV